MSAGSTVSGDIIMVFKIRFSEINQCNLDDCECPIGHC